MALRRTSKRVLPRPMPKPLSRSCSTPVPRPSSNNPASFGGLGLPLTGPPAPDMRSERTRKPARPERAPDFECLLIIATAEDALVRAMCNASPSAMVGSGQPPSPQEPPLLSCGSVVEDPGLMSLPGDLMAYSYTERKRIRKSFGTRDSVLEVPYLLQMQKDAYTAFLQADKAPQKRTIEGLQAAFDAAFPIVSHNGFVEMKFVEYNLAKPAFHVRHFQTPRLTLSSALPPPFQLIFYDP